MTSMIEKAAKALGEYFASGGRTWHGLDGRTFRSTTNEDAVRAILQAIREPDYTMEEAGADRFAELAVEYVHGKDSALTSYEAAGQILRAMLDTILNPQDTSGSK